MAANHAAILRQSRPKQPSNPTESSMSGLSDDRLSIISSSLSQLETACTSSNSSINFQPMDRVEHKGEINYFLNTSNHYDSTLKSLEESWQLITNDLDNLLEHLKKCCQTITGTSAQCLTVYKEKIDATCDEVDEGIKVRFKTNYVQYCLLILYDN